MPDKKVQPRKNASGRGLEYSPGTMAVHTLDFARWAWRPAVSVVAVALALLLGWHVVNGKNGLSVWMEKRAEDKQLHKEIDGLQQENARLRDRIDRLKTDPDAIGIVAREELHYAKPNEVIVSLPPEPQAQPAAVSK